MVALLFQKLSVEESSDLDALARAWPKRPHIPLSPDSNHKEPKKTGFRVKRITASVLADNDSDDEKAAIAGYFYRTEEIEDGHPLAEFRRIEIDGIRWATYEEKWLVSILGQPEQRGSLDFDGGRYHRWVWSDGRELFLSESSDGSGRIPYRVLGRELSVGGSPLLRVGDPKEKAEELLSDDLICWGTDAVVSAELDEEDKVALVTVSFRAADELKIPLSR